MRFFSQFRPDGLQRTGPNPEFYLERQHGPEKIIVEDDLYRYTRHRWLSNEENELEKRYLKFNLKQLLEIAINVCDGAQYCTRITKCVEGLHNKAFILKMDNGSEVFAKLLNPNAGPAHFSVASEVATRELLRNVFDIPIPRVLSWSPDAANNLVEAEYIIEEKAPGVRLGSVWNQWPIQLKLKLITQVVDIETKLTTITFDKHGCIYFKEDLRLLVGEAEEIHIQGGRSDVLERFSLGPLTTNELWSGNWANMNLERGPWKNALEYTCAMGHNEMMWIKAYAIPRQNHYRPKQNEEVLEDGISLLEKYMSVSSYLMPYESDELFSANVLWHLDLHLDNIFVDPDTCQITRLVDWQLAMCRYPRPVREGWVVPGRPEEFESLSEDEQKKVDDDLESKTIHKYYEAQVYKRAPLHWAVLEQPTTSILRKPVWLVTGVWENRDLFFLREALMNITAQWSELFPNTPYPIDFSSEDIELHSKEEENINGVGRMLLLFREHGVLPVDGMVDPEEYDLARENSRKFKDTFIGLAKDEEGKELFKNLWPY